MMSPLASYGFFPWLRRGLAGDIGHDESAGLLGDPRIVLDLDVTFNANATLSTSLSLELAGPGEVATLDPRAVIRTVPRADVHDAEPNYFPFVEFDQADLPWRYTPARAAANGRLTPWCCVICLADTPEEIAEYRPPDPKQKRAVVRVPRAQLLPRWNQLWGWAHAQLTGAKTATEADAATVLATEPHRIVSRILCPRRLDQKTSYRAFLVPTFERGRLAGLGLEVPESVDALQPAWDDGVANLELPVYHEWRFATGVQEDFEYLVRLLKPFVVPEQVGRRDMDVGTPGMDLPRAAPGPLALEGVLKTVRTTSTPWPPEQPERKAFLSKLRELINLPITLLRGGGPEVPVVVPPLYGQWHAARDELTETVLPLWFRELCEDPRNRVTAGLGTQVIQAQQRQLMAGAWEQVGRIREINEELRQKQLARLAAERLYTRHITTAGIDAMFRTAGPVLSRIAASPLTVHALLAQSPVAPGAIDPQLRRLTRPLGPIGRRLDRALAPATPRPTALLDRLNRGALTPNPKPALPAAVFTPIRTGAALRPPMLTSRQRPLFPRLFAALRRLAPSVRGRDALLAGSLTAPQLKQIRLPRGFVPSEEPPGPEAGPAPQPRPGMPSPRAAAEIFKEAAATALSLARPELRPGFELKPVDLSALRHTVVRALDPAVTIARGVRERLRVAGGGWSPKDPLQEVMVYPEFPHPMYEPLRDLGQDWLLPGLERVPTNSVSLLQTNQRFVEAYMVGLSHEMARELLWNEYPTDQRGTYFRQFWDVKGYVPPPGETIDPETLKDIKPIHTWRLSAALRDNSSRRPPPGGEHLVLLVRGDLLRRYPETMVYAIPASWVSGQRVIVTDTDQEKHPVFRGTLKPDITFFGFELTEGQARGTDDSSDNKPGWFFVLQERPTEPRFGLDIAESFGGRPATWNEFTWGHLAADEGELRGITYIDLTRTPPDTSQAEAHATGGGAKWHVTAGARASDLAYVTLQVPARIAIHGSLMLPSPEGDGGTS